MGTRACWRQVIATRTEILWRGTYQRRLSYFPALERQPGVPDLSSCGQQPGRSLYVVWAGTAMVCLYLLWSEKTWVIASSNFLPLIGFDK